MSNASARSRALMLPYSFGTSLCRFCCFAGPQPGYSHSNTASLLQSEMKMHARADAPSDQVHWPDDIFAVLQRFDVRQVPYVPDAGHSQLIDRVLATPSMRAVPLTTEEEGVALLAG